MEKNKQYYEQVNVMPREDGPYCVHYGSNLPHVRLRRLLNKEVVRVGKNLCKELGENMIVRITLEKI